jgi:hypothetical protein
MKFQSITLNFIHWSACACMNKFISDLFVRSVHWLYFDVSNMNATICLHGEMYNQCESFGCEVILSN